MPIKKPEIKSKGCLPQSCLSCTFYKQVSESTNKKNPVFSLKYLQRGYGVDECPDNDKIALIKKIAYLSKLTWQDIYQNHRHGTGQEKITRSSLNVEVPSCVKDDTNLIAIRYNGLAPIVGFRENDIFHILWIDFNYNVYNH